VLLIDTAGRLQNKQALMDELEKVIRVLRKLDPSAPHQGPAGAGCNHRSECP
jgi:fused signal recognition particle receptor